jgi:hypothetical protein
MRETAAFKTVSNGQTHMVPHGCGKHEWLERTSLKEVELKK